MEQVVGEIDADKRREEREAEARRTQVSTIIVYIVVLRRVWYVYSAY